jgi:hypothetical protein
LLWCGSTGTSRPNTRLGAHFVPQFSLSPLTCLAEGWIEPIEGLISQLSNPPERMVRRDPILDREVGDQGPAALLLTSNQRLGGSSF